VDGPAEEYRELVNVVFGGDVKAFAETYFSLMAEMITTQTPDIVGHLDLIKKNNQNSLFFSETEKWYRDKVEDLLEIISRHNVIVEVNTGGIARGYLDEVYPSEWILKLIREMDIPVVLNSDAHHPDWIDAYYPEAVKILKNIGFSHQRVLLDGTWQNVLL